MVVSSFFVQHLQVTRLRLLGDHVHSTRIAFVEFAMVSLWLLHLRLMKIRVKILLRYVTDSVYP